MEQNTAATPRLPSLDIVRGVAVLGILLLNILSFAMPDAAYVNPRGYGGWQGADLVAWAVNFILFDGKMRGLFSFLFGASTLLVIERSGANPAEVHYRRMAWLLVFGIGHLFLIWHGDILAHYALVGMIAFAMRDMAVPRLLILGTMLVLASIVLFATVPLAIVAAQARDSDLQALHDYTLMFGVPSPADIAKELALHRGGYLPLLRDRLNHDGGALFGLMVFFGPETLGYMLFGMAALRSGMLRGDWARARYLRWLLTCWTIALPAYAALAWWQWTSGFDMRVVAAMMPLTALARPPMIAGWICLILLLARPGGWLTSKLAAAGRMAFTNYLATSLICTTLFYGYGLGWYGYLSRWQLYPVVFAIWAAILAWSSLWLAHYRFGPLEWLWRSLARGRLQPLRGSALRNNASASQ